MATTYYTNTGVYIEQGRQVKLKRKLLKWSQRELAIRAGVAQTRISEIEKGRYISPSSYNKILSALNSGLKEEKLFLMARYNEKIRECEDILNILKTI